MGHDESVGLDSVATTRYPNAGSIDGVVGSRPISYEGPLGDEDERVGDGRLVELFRAGDEKLPDRFTLW